MYVHARIPIYVDSADCRALCLDTCYISSFFQAHGHRLRRCAVCTICRCVRFSRRRIFWLSGLVSVGNLVVLSLLLRRKTDSWQRTFEILSLTCLIIYWNFIDFRHNCLAPADADFCDAHAQVLGSLYYAESLGAAPAFRLLSCYPIIRNANSEACFLFQGLMVPVMVQICFYWILIPAAFMLVCFAYRKAYDQLAAELASRYA